MDRNYKGFNYIGKVIRILSPTTIIIDAGDMDVTVGDKIQIYTTSDNIVDLEGNFLGVYENIKDTLEVVQTSENYSVCEKIVTTKTSPLSTVGLFTSPTVTTSKAKLNVDESQIKPLNGDDEASSLIQLGDYVKRC